MTDDDSLNDLLNNDGPDDHLIDGLRSVLIRHHAALRLQGMAIERLLKRHRSEIEELRTAILQLTDVINQKETPHA